MAAFERDAALERQQIQEISVNVARRLLAVHARARYAPPAAAAEIEATSRVITGIQRDVAQIVSGMPAHAPLDIAILTHILGGLQHALEQLEALEARLAAGAAAAPPPPDPARAHAALIATARAIEEDARRYRAPAAAPRREPRMPPAAGAGAGRPRAPSSPPSRAKALRPAADVRAAVRALVARPAAAAMLGALTVMVALGLTALSLRPAGSDSTETQAAAATAGEKLDGRLAAAAVREDQGTGAAPPSAALEQPYLVVLSTRRSTEELQQDLRAYKAAYPEQLATAKARVDRLEGLDRQAWYRLSLIPPKAHAEAKALCSSLRKAGLSGCWIKPVPLPR